MPSTTTQGTGETAMTDEMTKRLTDVDFEGRISRRDTSLWKEDAHHSAVIANRLGWLDSPASFQKLVEPITALADELVADGIEYIALLGMGGSSMAPEVFARVFGRKEGYPRLTVLDTTDPRAIQRVADYIDPRKTAFISATKSGSTIETLTLQDFFWNRLVSAGIQSPGSHFIAITDPGSSLIGIAEERGFRACLTNPSDIGGRYSALSYFGLMPAAALGVDIRALLDSAISTQSDMTPALSLGAFMATCAAAGRDKLTFAFSPALSPFGAWAEQLIAESLGKEGKGVVPVDNEPLGAASDYGDDRCFVSMRLASEAGHDSAVDALEQAGSPVHRIVLSNTTDLGAQFFDWEYATAAAGALMGVDPFDEPNVTESKNNTAAILSAVEAGTPVPVTQSQAGDFVKVVDAMTPGQYLCIQAYITHDTVTREAIERLRIAVRSRRKVATTFGWGPRFLHSTGQLHKGGPKTGVFLQLVESGRPRVTIPGKDWGFDTLIDAQAAGDLEAIRDKGLTAIRVDVGDSALQTIDALADQIG